MPTRCVWRAPAFAAAMSLPKATQMSLGQHSRMRPRPPDSEFVHPDDRAAVDDAREKRALHIRAEYLAEMRRNAGLTQGEVAEAAALVVGASRDTQGGEQVFMELDPHHMA